jgi:Ca-activated chloride channel family protein
MHFASPFALVLLLLLPVLYGWSHYRRRGTALRFSSAQLAAGAGVSLRQRCRPLLAALRFAALALFIVALARPQAGQERIRDLSKGIAIEVVIDRSGSMAEEMDYSGQTLNRLDVVKRVFEEFVHGNGDSLSGRPADLIGLITFAGYADTIAPLTLGHDALSRLVQEVQLVQLESEDGTAIGDALALAAARLKTAEEAQQRVNASLRDDYEIKSKIIILLTDGQNNRGQMAPEDAVAMAREWGITIYAIGIGNDPNQAAVRTAFGTLALPTRRALDESMLSMLAEETGGLYRRADSADALRAIYEEIGELEKSEVESYRYLDYRENFTPFALAGLGLLLAEILLQSTWLRRHP